MNKLMKIFTNALVFVCAGGAAFAAFEEDVFSGVYKEEYQLFPNTMATYCKLSAEDAVKDVQKIKDCVNRLALKRRSADAEISREGFKEINQIKADELQELISLAAAKGAAVGGYYAKTSLEAQTVNTDSNTVSDVDASAINTTKVLTSVVNSLRDLYVEQLKSVAIANIENIDKEALLEIASLEDIKEAQKQIEAKKQEASKAENTSADNEKNKNDGDVSNSSQSENTDEFFDDIPMEVRVVDGVCVQCERNGSKIECRRDVCPDGEYRDANDANIVHVCKDGNCEPVNLRAAE